LCERAKAELSKKNLLDQIEIVCAPAADYIFEKGAFDAATCIGATFAFGGYKQTIQALKQAVHKNGRLGIGETYWLSSQVHPEYAQKQTTTYTEIELPIYPKRRLRTRIHHPFKPRRLGQIHFRQLVRPNTLA